MKTSHLALVLVTCLPSPLFAEEPSPDDDRDSLMALLEEQTAIATRTRMNADYVPGMVTVLHGEELEARGVRTVWEALALVPGMETAIEKTGRRKVLVRGLGNTWASGAIKILLNDASMNSAELGLAEPVFNMPVEQVDRIEVIRGPGSAVYGEYAYMGVINVITRNEENRVYAFGGSFNTAGAGASIMFTSPESPVRASMSISGWRSSGADVNTGNDFVYAFGMGDISNAPGPANEEIDAGSGVFNLGYERFSLTAQWVRDGMGDHFGASFFLPPDPNRIVEQTTHRAIDMRQELPVSPSLTIGLQATWKDVERNRDQFFIRPDISGTDYYLRSDYLETTNSMSADLSYRGLDKHSLFFSASSGNTNVSRSSSRSTPDLGAGILVLPGTERYMKAYTAQDEYRHSDLFTLTTGIRYDEYSDTGPKSSPRIAGVWRLDERNIVKAQYAEAFRPATLFESAAAEFYGQEVPLPASIQTSELGYVFKGERNETRLTCFYSTLTDLVVFSASDNYTFYTSESARAWGVELQQTSRLSANWAVDANASYVDTRDDESGEPFPGAAPWIANASIGYKDGDFTARLQSHYVSGYLREATDRRSTLSGYTTVDGTISFQHVLSRGMQVRIGVKNLFDSDVRYPAPAVLLFPGDPSSAVPTYPTDFPQPGRSWWLQLSYRRF